MISVFELRRDYNKLYTQFRNYIWNYDIVEQFVDLEMEIYKACPDMFKLSDIMRKLKQNIQRIMDDDEDFQEAFDELEEIVDKNSDSYYAIHTVNEVIQDEDQ